MNLKNIERNSLMEKYDNGKVICQVCGKSFIILGNHIKRHDMTTEEYKEKFPDCPMTSSQFKAKMKYSSNKNDLFDNSDKIVDEVITIVDEVITIIDEPEVMVNEEPYIEEIDEVIILEKSNSDLNVIEQSREEILDLLSTYFHNVKQNYMITKFFLDKRIEYEFITDYCDPMLKIVIDFPTAFWHNSDRYVNYNRDHILEQDGWKIIKINSTSLYDIQKSLR